MVHFIAKFLFRESSLLAI